MKILVVCETNVVHSPMYTEVLKRYLGSAGYRGTTVESAGALEESRGKEIAPAWLLLEDITGIDLSGHLGRWIGDIDLTVFDSIICTNVRVYGNVRKLDPALRAIYAVINLGADGENPEKGTDAEFRRCYKEICSSVARLPSSVLSNGKRSG